MNERDLVRLGHIVAAVRQAKQILGEGEPESVLDEPARRYALIYLVQVVGEAASRLSDEAKASLPELPWPAIVAMRHRLVHGYFQVRDDVLAETLRRDLPELGRHLEPHVPEEFIGPL